MGTYDVVAYELTGRWHYQILRMTEYGAGVPLSLMIAKWKTEMAIRTRWTLFVRGLLIKRE